MIFFQLILAGILSLGTEPVPVWGKENLDSHFSVVITAAVLSAAVLADAGFLAAGFLAAGFVGKRNKLSSVNVLFKLANVVTLRQILNVAQLKQI